MYSLFQSAINKIHSHKKKYIRDFLTEEDVENI